MADDFRTTHEEGDAAHAEDAASRRDNGMTWLTGSLSKWRSWGSRLRGRDEGSAAECWKPGEKAQAGSAKGTPIIPLPTSQAARGPHPRKPGPAQPRLGFLPVSFLVFVLLPTLLAGSYYAFIASDRYVAGGSFSIRALQGDGAGDGPADRTEGPIAVAAESRVLIDYLQSRDLVQHLLKDYDFASAYGRDGIDFIYRLAPNANIAGIVDHWRTMFTTDFDPMTGVISFEVEAFDPDDAQQIAALVLGYSAEFVSTLSDAARRDAVRFSEEDVSTAEARLRTIKSQLRKYRQTETPAAAPQDNDTQEASRAELEQRLAVVRARLGVLQDTIDESAPSVKQLRQEEASLVGRINAQPTGTAAAVADSDVANDADAAAAVPVPTTQEEYDALEAEREFALYTYMTALASLERSRTIANLQQRHLAVFSTPAYPADPAYPRRALNTISLFAGLLATWGLAMLLVRVLRARSKQP